MNIVLVLDPSESGLLAKPDDLLASASLALLNGMDTQARIAVVSFKDSSEVIQGLTSDKPALITAINTIGNTRTNPIADVFGEDADLGAGVQSALDVLSADESGVRGQAIIVMSDGKGLFDSSLTSQAAARGVRIFTVGLGSSPDKTLLTAIAHETGGTSSVDDSAADSAVVRGQASGGADIDGDGLGDCLEIQGAWDATGILHVTNPQNADTDGDGLTDGQEVTNDLKSFDATQAAGLLSSQLAGGRFRYVVSDPNSPDSDGDGADDPLEFDMETQPFVSDSDGDGLSDFDEADDYGTNPLAKNTDGDARDDGWEVDHASAGFDAVVYDEEISKLSYAKDFAAGATCPDGWDICEAETTAFLAGSIVGGVFGYKDVIDFLGSLTKLDFVGAGLAAPALLPVAGDALSAVAKAVRFVQRVPARRQVDGLAYLASTSIPVSARMEILQRVDGSSVDVLKAEGMTDDAILSVVQSRTSLAALSQAVDRAAVVEKSPRLFPQERDAQNYLAGKTPGSMLEVSFRCPLCASGSTLGSRRVDVYDAASKTAIEVKHGYVYSSTTRDEVAKDVALLADPSTPIDSVIWQFYPKVGGRVGPDDELRELLIASGIPYEIHLP